jgi:DNA-binding transcriptional regulator YiaG
VVREVPAIVDENTWRKAQETLAQNLLFGARNTKNCYLLRGLAKCGLCGLTFIGSKTVRTGGKVDFYYRCNGKHGTRGLFGAEGKRCPSKDMNGSFLEQAIWNDIEGFLRNPGEVAEALRQNIAKQGSTEAPELDRRAIEGALASKSEERSRVLALFRKGRIDEAALDAQLSDIETEETALQERLTAANRVEPATSMAALASVEEMLKKLQAKLGLGVPWELKRELVEVLVDGITVDTVETGHRRVAVVNARYRFSLSDSSEGELTARHPIGQTEEQSHEEPQTVGDHLRVHRVSLGLLQRQTAVRIGVNKATIANWESNRSKPAITSMPAIIRLLGYVPLSMPHSISDRLVHSRTLIGLSQGEAAERIGVDQCTLARWERGEREPLGPHKERTQAFIDSSQEILRQQLSASPSELKQLVLPR